MICDTCKYQDSYCVCDAGESWTPKEIGEMRDIGKTVYDACRRNNIDIKDVHTGRVNFAFDPEEKAIYRCRELFTSDDEFTSDDDYIGMERELIMTKEAFRACFEKWIKGDEL